MELKVPPVILVLFTAIGMLLISKLAPSFGLIISGRLIIGILLIFIGIVIAISGVIEFRRANTTVDPRDPNKSARLVNTGVYTFSRNPMYLGFALILLGWLVMLANIAAMILLPVFVFYLTQFQIKPEERFLSQKFGTEFDEYRRRVRRWI